MTCCLRKNAEMEWGPPNRAMWTPQDFSADFLLLFCVTLEDLFFSSGKTSKKNLRTKNLRKNLRKILRTKNLRKNNCFGHCKKPFLTFRFSGRWKPQKKFCANLRKNPSPKKPREGAGAKRPPVFLNPSKIFLWAREEETGKVRKPLPQKSLSLDRNFR